MPCLTGQLLTVPSTDQLNLYLKCLQRQKWYFPSLVLLDPHPSNSSAIHKVRKTNGQITQPTPAAPEQNRCQTSPCFLSFFGDLLHSLVRSKRFYFCVKITLRTGNFIRKNTYLHPGNSPLTFWNSLWKSDHLPCRIVRPKGERCHGEKCASAAATWCVWAKKKKKFPKPRNYSRTRWCDDAFNAWDCAQFRKGKESSVVPPPPRSSTGAMTQHRWPRCSYSRSASSAWWLRCGCAAAADWREQRRRRIDTEKWE